MRWTCSIIAAAWLLAGAARADVISTPEACPEGSTPGSCHGPETCAPLTCASDAECMAGRVCRERSLCAREHCCSGRCCGGGCPTPPQMATHVAGPCGAGDTCAEAGTSCQSMRVCVPDDAVEDAGGEADAGASTPAGGGCCSVAGARSALGGGLFVAVVGVWVVRRRLRRARPTA